MWQPDLYAAAVDHGGQPTLGDPGYSVIPRMMSDAAPTYAVPDHDTQQHPYQGAPGQAGGAGAYEMPGSMTQQQHYIPYNPARPVPTPRSR